MFKHLVDSSNENNVTAALKISHTHVSSAGASRLPLLRKKTESFVQSSSSAHSPFLRLASLVETTTTQAARISDNPVLDGNEHSSHLPVLNQKASQENMVPAWQTSTFNPHGPIINVPPIEAVKYSENDKVPSHRVGEGMWSSSCWSSNDNIANPQVDEAALATLGRGSTYQQRRKKRRDSWDTSPPEDALGLLKETPAALKLRVRRWLLKKGVPGVPSFDERFWASWSPSLLRVTPLHEAAFEGDLAICKHLLEHGVCSVMNSDNVLGDTPLHLASYKGHLDVVKWLYNSGANLKVKNQVGNSCFVLAGREGHIKVMLWLIEYGALNYYEEGNEEWAEIEEFITRSLALEAKEMERKEKGKKSKGKNKRGSVQSSGNTNVKTVSSVAPSDPHHPLWLPIKPEEDEQFVNKGGDMRQRWSVGPGHVSRSCLDLALGIPSEQEDNRQRKLLRIMCKERIELHSIYTRVVLPATSSALRSNLMSRNGQSSLAVIGGAKKRSKYLMQLIAEFLGVPVGRQLRNLREALVFL